MFLRRSEFYLASFIVAGALVWSVTASAQGAQGSKKLALVIGNSAYRDVARLANPVNDATDIAKKLKSLQFDVLLATDADHAKTVALLQDFRNQLTRDHVGLVFYAGHGVTVNTESFILPVDAPALIEFDEGNAVSALGLNKKLVSMATVLAPLEAAKIGIVFLDTCRTSSAVPGVGLSLRVVSLATKRAIPVLRGTGPLPVKPSLHSAGVFRAYATQLDNVAADGSGRNSPFTKALLQHMGTPGISIQELMIRVRKQVMQETGNEQVPWEEAALNEIFYFVPPSAPVAGRPTSGPAAAGKSGGGAANTNLPPNIGAGGGSGL